MLADRALADARPSVFWLDDPDAPTAGEPLAGPTTADLAVVGGGYTGLWTALRAKERYPELDVVVLEAIDLWECGERTQRRFLRCEPDARVRERAWLVGRMSWRRSSGSALENLEAIGDTVAKYKIDCGWERTGELTVATAPHHLEELAEEASTRQAARP